MCMCIHACLCVHVYVCVCESDTMAPLLPPELQRKHERKMVELREEMELRKKTEIHEVEEVRLSHHNTALFITPALLSLSFSLSLSHYQRKNGQISTLMKNHEKAFSDIKNYYNDITLNNLALINSLKVYIYMYSEVYYLHVR